MSQLTTACAIACDDLQWLSMRNLVGNRLRVLELFAGIGGCAAAVGDAAEFVAAIDINPQALAVYRHNFSHPTICSTIEPLPAESFRAWNADLWWLSPPCQPYTHKGKQRDLADPRAAALLTLIERIEQVRPRYVALENVPPFGRSRTRQRLLDALARSGYYLREELLCPTDLGLPNRRRRYYLVASLEAIPERLLHTEKPRLLREFVDVRLHDNPLLLLDAASTKRFREALDIVDADNESAVASCFTAAYGRSVVRSGSYLRIAAGLRRFAPEEVLRLLGFPASYRLPPDLTLHRAWRLLGNSLSIGAVRSILSPILKELPQGEANTKEAS
jgi:site-specific DNA-cytosine methylase